MSSSSFFPGGSDYVDVALASETLASAAKVAIANSWTAKQPFNFGYSVGTVNYVDGAQHSTNVDGEFRIVDNANPAVETLFGVHHADPTKRVFAIDSGSDTFNRFFIDGNGGQAYGPGNTAQDTSTLRLSPGAMGLNGVAGGPTTFVIGDQDASVPAGGFNNYGLCFTSINNFFGVFFGSGAPTLSAGKGSLYLRTDGSSSSTRMYVNSGTGVSTTWVAVTTAS